MPIFSCRAVDINGRTRRIEVDAADQQEVTKFLQAEFLIPTEVREATAPIHPRGFANRLLMAGQLALLGVSIPALGLVRRVLNVLVLVLDGKGPGPNRE